MVKNFLFLLLILTACSVSTIEQSVENQNVYGGIINKNLVWKNVVVIEKDVLIPEGINVIIEPGTKILINKSETTRTEPIFLQPETEILVRGKLIAKGLTNKPIFFISSEKDISKKDWGGIVIDGGSFELSKGIIKNASTAITLINGNIDIKETIIDDNNYGIVLLENGKGSISNCIIKNNKSAMIIDNKNITLKNIKISNNEEGLIIKNINPHATGLEINKNETGIIIPTNFLNFFIMDNRIYENKVNVFFFLVDNANSQ